MFRICNFDADDPGFAEALKRYNQHIEHCDHKSARDLWRYFAYDFFHDGVIKRVVFEPNLRTLHLHISAPNIKYRNNSDLGFRFVEPLDFKCTFYEVVEFQQKLEFYDRVAEDPGDGSTEEAEHYMGYINDTPDPWLEFRYAEVDTLKESIAHWSKLLEGAFEVDDDHDMHSLIVECDDARVRGWVWMQFVFRDICVTANEPAVFELMCNSDDYEVSLYQSPQWDRS